MVTPTLLFLLFSTASAFSPSSLPPPQQRASNIQRGSSSPPYQLFRYNAIHPSSRNAVKPLPLLLGSANSANSIKTNKTRSGTKLAMSAITDGERQYSCKNRIAFLMTFLTGWADFIFFQKYNFFSTMMTSNCMPMTKAFFDGRMIDTVFYVTVMLSYMLGVAALRRTELSYNKKGLQHAVLAPVVAGFLLLSDFITSTDPSSKFMPAILRTFSWGIINTAGQNVVGTFIFVGIVAVANLGTMMVNQTVNESQRKTIPKEDLVMSLNLVGGLTFGGIWGAILSRKAPNLATCGAFSIMGGIYALLFTWLDRESLGAWWSKKKPPLASEQK